MKKEEYIKKATGKIFVSSRKVRVTRELGDHITKRIEWFSDIGYDAQTSEEKAVEAMGDAELIADELGKIHNYFYNPLPDIAAVLIGAGALGGMYYLLQKYVFFDLGALALIFCALFIANAMLLASQLASIIRKRIAPSLFTLLGWGFTNAFYYLIFKQLNISFNASFGAFVDYLKSSAIPSSYDLASTAQVRNIFIIIAAASAFLSAVPLIYSVKRRLMITNRADNAVLRFSKKVAAILLIVSTAGALFFGVRFFTDRQNYYDNYMHGYETALAITEKETAEEAAAYIEKCDIPFDLKYDENGRLVSCSYYNKAYSLYVAFNDGENEDYSQYSAQNPLFYDYDASNPDKLFNVSFEVISIPFKRSFNSITGRMFCIPYEDSDRLHAADRKDMPADEQLKLFKSLPAEYLFTTVYANRALTHEYKFTFVIGYGYAKREEGFYINCGSHLPDYMNKIDEITQAIMQLENKSDYEAVAAATGADYVLPDLTLEEYKRGSQYLGSYFYVVKDDVETMYAQEISFEVDDDLGFRLYGRPINRIRFSLDNHVFYKRLTENGKYFNYNYADFHRVSVEGWYYDRNGLAYADCLNAPLYTRSGDRYYYHSEIGEYDEEKKTNSVHCFANEKNVYNIDDCYVDEEGYLVFLSQIGTLSSDGNGNYTSPSGKKYYSPLITSWDSDGVLLFQNSDNQKQEDILS